ncbi:MAG: non-ribosomal peptide synthetase [Caulobacteraceae bacterium]
MSEATAISADEFIKARDYWLSVLSGEITDAHLYYDFKLTSGFGNAVWKFTIDGHVLEKIYSLCREQDLLLYIILVSVFKVLLYKCSDQSDIIVASPLYAMTGEYYEHNAYVILRDFVTRDMTFKDLLSSVKKTVLEGYKNQYYPVERILDTKGIDKESVLRYVILLDNIHNRDIIEGSANICPSDMVLSFSNKHNRIECSIKYNTALFAEETIKRLEKCYNHILCQSISNINIRLADIEMLNEKSRNQILLDFSNMDVQYQTDKTISELFDEQAKKYPDNIAVIYEDQLLTYAELSAKVDQLARLLQKKGVRADCLVGIMVEYSIEMVVGILAVLKAGGAYLPIDPSYPLDRIRYMIRDAAIDILLSQKSLISKGISLCKDFISLDDEKVYEDNSTAIVKSNTADSLAYVIYTSGSTGKPKGVMIEQKSLINYTNWRIKRYGLNQEDRTLQLISLSFDGFGSNFFSSLLSGGALVIPNGHRWGDFNYISKLISEKKVTNMSVVPSMYRVLLESTGENSLDTLRMVILAGERSSSDLIKLSQEKKPDLIIVNEYGPTETCITSTAFIGMSPEDIAIIGRPIDNNMVFILNSDNNIMPVGITGELCISGIGVARGYLNMQDDTKDKFVPNPFVPGERMYRTGDLARWLPDGNIELLGRRDNQVKIRGYRIELGEIEKKILEYTMVKEAVVIDREDKNGGKYLCAYISCDEGMQIDELKERLSRVLPDYMIPSYFVRLKKLPTNSNGKIDKKALAEPERFSGNRELVKPRTDIEIKISDIWCSLLNIDDVSIEESFFSLGGNSLLLMRMHSQIDKLYPKCVTIKDIFTYPTIAKIAEQIEKARMNLHATAGIKYTEFPPEYFNDGTNDNSCSSFRMQMPQDLVLSTRDVCKKFDVDIHDVLIAVTIYLLAKVTSRENIMLYVMMDEPDRVCSLNFSLSNIETMRQFITSVNKSRIMDIQKDLKIRDLHMAKERKNRNFILPAYKKEDLMPDGVELTDVFDIVFSSFIDDDTVFISCMFNSSLMNQQMIETLLQNYMKLVKAIIAKC